MSQTVHERIVQRAVAGRYPLFLGLGGGLAILGAILFIQSLSSGDAARTWQLFHVNWLFFTSLSTGSVAFVAVQKISNAKWSGVMLRFASASAAFLPVSLIALLLIFTVGYPAIYGPMNAMVPRPLARQGHLALATTSCSRGSGSGCWFSRSSAAC